MAYTAKQVRDMIRAAEALGPDLADRIARNEFGYTDDISLTEVLASYADRLEQDEQDCDDCINNESFDKGHAVGQREVYREIAAMALLPIEHDYSTFKVVHLTCAFCGREPIAYQAWEAHAPNCLWLRATAALRETTPTPLIVERMTADTVIVGRGYRRNPETGEIEPV